MFSASGATITTDDLARDYPYLVDHVLATGGVVPSRIGETKEILNLRLELLHPEMCIVGRKGLSESFMQEEILQLLAGVHDNDRLRAILPQAADLITPATAYGPRTWEQLEAVETELKSSPTSRRAVVYIGRPTDLWRAEGDAGTAGEMPCTETWQFHLRNGKLHMTVSMRSWDVVWGLAYDIPSFVAVQMALAKALTAELGTYVHTAGSGHVYDRHYDIQTWSSLDGELNLDDFLGATVRETREEALLTLSS